MLVVQYSILASTETDNISPICRSSPIFNTYYVCQQWLSNMTTKKATSLSSQRLFFTTISISQYVKWVGLQLQRMCSCMCIKTQQHFPIHFQTIWEQFPNLKTWNLPNSNAFPYFHNCVGTGKMPCSYINNIDMNWDSVSTGIVGNVLGLSLGLWR